MATQLVYGRAWFKPRQFGSKGHMLNHQAKLLGREGGKEQSPRDFKEE